MKNITTILIIAIVVLAVVLGGLLFTMNRNGKPSLSDSRREPDAEVTKPTGMMQSTEPTPTAVPAVMEGDKFMLVPVTFGAQNAPVSTQFFKSGATIRIPNRSGQPVRLVQPELGVDAQIADNSFHEMKLTQAGLFDFRVDKTVVLRIKVQ